MNIKVHRGLDQIGGCITEYNTPRYSDNRLG